MLAKQILKLLILLKLFSFSRTLSFGSYSSPNFKQIFQILPQECFIWFMMDQSESQSLEKFAHADQPIVTENFLHKKNISKTTEQIKSLFVYKNTKCLIIFLCINNYTSTNESNFLFLHYGVVELYHPSPQFKGIESVKSILAATHHYQNIFYVSLSPFLLTWNYSEYIQYNNGPLYFKDPLVFIVLPIEIERKHSQDTFICVVQIISSDNLIPVCNILNSTDVQYDLRSFKQIFKAPNAISYNDALRETWRDYPLMSLGNEVPVNPQAYLVLSVINRLNMTLNNLWPLQSYPYVEASTWMFPQAKMFLVLRSEPIIFITCYTYDPFVSFKLYFSAFDYKIWLAILASFILLSSFMNCLLWKQKQNMAKVDFSPWLFYLRFLIDEPINLKKELSNDITFNILSFPWIALSIILTCLYASSLVTNLNLPVSGEKLTESEQAYCPEAIGDKFAHRHIISQFLSYPYQRDALKLRLNKYIKTMADFKKETARVRTIIKYDYSTPNIFPKRVLGYTSLPSWALPLSDLDLDLYSKQYQIPTNCFTMLSSPKLTDKNNYISDPGSYFLVSELKIRTVRAKTLYRAKNRKYRYYPKLDKIWKIQKFVNESNLLRHSCCSNISPASKKYTTLVNRLLFNNSLVIEAGIEDELNECGKTVYFAERSLALRELYYLNLNYKNKFYAVTERPIVSLPKGVEYDSSVGEKFQGYLRRLLESGLYKEIVEMVQEQKYLKRRLLTIKLLGVSTRRFVDKVRINGSIQTVFYLCLSLLFVSACVLFFEIRISQVLTIWRQSKSSIVSYSTRSFKKLFKKSSLSTKRYTSCCLILKGLIKNQCE